MTTKKWISEMLIDVLIIVSALVGLFVGFKRGIIYSLFMAAGFVAGIVLALLLSDTVSWYLLSALDWNMPYVPIISFLIVFISVLLIARIASRILEGFVNMVALGIINKLGGAILYVGITLFTASTILWFLDQSAIISPEQKAQSKTYDMVAPISPGIMAMAGGVLPGIGDIYDSLEDFYEEAPTDDGPVDI